MLLGRSFIPSVALLLILAGCGTMQNTVAQDLARERWNRCNHFRSTTLKEILPDGQIWVWSIAASRACDSAVLAANGMTEPPVWRPGDEWVYWYESPAGSSGTYVWSVDREEAIDGIPHYVIKTGTREIFYRKSDFAATRETVDGTIVLDNKPSRLQLVWPLQTGMTWQQPFVEEHPATRQTSERIDTVTVEAEETVTVPAGTFKTFKVVYRNEKTGATRYEAWYSLELKQVVKLRENSETGLRIRELIAFTLR